MAIDQEARLHTAIAKWRGYDVALKQQFKTAALGALRELRTRLGIDAEVRFNPGGIAVSGDAILHGDHIYVHVSVPFGGGSPIYFRTVNGRKDYIGGRNHHAYAVDLFETVTAFVKSEPVHVPF